MSFKTNTSVVQSLADGRIAAAVGSTVQAYDVVLDQISTLTLSGNAGKALVVGGAGDSVTLTENLLGTAAFATIGTGNGNLPSLDSNGKLPTSVIPSLALVDVSAVADLSERDELDVQEGDVAIVTSENKTYIYDGSAWIEILTPPDAVQSVAGKTGVVTLELNDLTDVTITAPTTGNVLRHNGSGWVNVALAYSDLTGTPTLGTMAAEDAGDYYTKTEVDNLIDGAGGDIADLQTEVDAIETSVGLNTDGTKPDFTSVNYILAADSVVAAINKLDTALDTAVTDLTSDIGDVQTAVDNVETGAGLQSDGSYAYDATTNYLKESDFTAALYNPNLKNADKLLDAKIKEIADDLANLSQNEIVSLDGFTTVKADNTGVQFRTDVDGAATLVGSIVGTDATDSEFVIDVGTAGEVRFEATSGTATNVDIRLVPQGSGQVIIGDTGAAVIQSEDGFDLTLSGGDNAAGAGGDLVLKGGDGSTTDGIVQVLDGAGNEVMTFEGTASATSYIKAVNGTTSVGLEVVGTGNVDLVLNPLGTGSVDASSAVIKNVADPVNNQDAATKAYVDTAISGAGGDIADLQTEVDAIETGVGLNTDGTKPNFTSVNYVLAADTIVAAINKLDTALDTAVTDLTSDIGDVQTEVDAIETSVGLNTDGTKPNFTSTNFILAADSVVAAINKLDTAVDGKADAVHTHVAADITDFESAVEAIVGTTVDNSIATVAVVTAAGDYTATDVNYVIIVNKTSGAATTVTLPTAPATGKMIVVKDGKGDASTNNITVDGGAADIDGVGTQVINNNYESATFVFNGTQWNII